MSNMPKTIYHYCDFKALCGILGVTVNTSTNSTTTTFPELWLTESSFLNDPSESSYLTEMVQVLKEDNNKLCETFCNVLIPAKYENQNPTYVMSFSTLKDHLPLWSLYTNLKKVNEQFCIGFDVETLKKELSTVIQPINNCSFKIQKVRYFTAEKLKEYIVINLLPEFITAPDEFERFDLHIFTKNKKYEYEKEVRLIVEIPENNSEVDNIFNTLKWGLPIPRYKIRLDLEKTTTIENVGSVFEYERTENRLNELISEIIVGPNCDYNKAFHCLRFLTGLDKNIIKNSEIPYRI